MNYISTFATLIIGFSSTFVFGQAGSLDPTFDSDGIVTTLYSGDNDGEGVAIQPDGKIVLVGTSDAGLSSLRVVRYLEDGSLDNSFGTGGTVVLNTSVGRSVAIQADGKILVAGTTSNGNDFDIIVARLNSDGTFDSSFGTAGIATTDVSSMDDICENLVIQPDGKIVIAGSTYNGTDADLLLVRYNTDGTLDTGFGTGGITSIDHDTEDQAGEFLMIQTDGKIVIGGTHFVSLISDIIVARVNADGSIDTGFGTAGIVTTDVILGNDVGTFGEIQTDGKILVCGDSEITIGPTSSIDFCTVRYNTDGTLDNSFGSGGIVTTDLDNGDDIGTSIAVQTNGSILVSGDAMIGGMSQFAMVRYLSDGTLDSSFGTNGEVNTQIGAVEDLCNAMVLQSDTLIVLIGESDTGSGESEFALARYSTGTADLTVLDVEESQLSLYPNPVTSESVLEYVLNQNEKISIGIYSASGQLIRFIVENENQEAGSHTVEISDFDDMPKGSYILKVESQSSVRSIKLIR